MKLPSILALLSSVSVAAAGWARNINYRSPSEHHPGLGIAIHKVVRRNDPGEAYDPANLNFTHGVASGDPYHDSVILWTRAAPTSDNDRSNVTVSGNVGYFNHDTEKYVKASKYPVCVEWKIAASDDFGSVVDSGTVYTSSDIDYTVKVEATHLEPFTEYFYQFNICDSDITSPLGRTKTIPRADDDVEEVNLAVYSCANFPAGFFNGYGNPVRKDSVDYVVHLGDYLYEYENGYYGDGTEIDRIPQPEGEIYTLYDYRKRHATYRTDLDLLLSHQNFAWIPVWDDHEIADNTYRDGATNMNNTEESFVADGGVSFDQRKMNAVRAYFEWMPIRQVEMDDNLRIWRSFQIGKLADLIMLDTRQYDRSITDLHWNGDYITAISDDAGRSLMGSRQENWFYGELKRSSDRGAAWRVVGSQIILTHLAQPEELGGQDPINLDSWDTYRANRNRTWTAIYDNEITDNIFLAGDFHSAWASDLVWEGEKDYDPETGTGAVGVEFAGTAVGSPSILGEEVTLEEATEASKLFVPNHDPLQWSELFYRGYIELNVRMDRVEARYFGLPDLKTRNGLEISVANFTVEHGANHLARPISDGVVSAGTVQGGERVAPEVVFDTETGEYLAFSKGGEEGGESSGTDGGEEDAEESDQEGGDESGSEGGDAE